MTTLSPEPEGLQLQNPHREYLRQRNLEGIKKVSSGELTPEQLAEEITDREIELERQASLDGLTGFLNNVSFSGQLVNNIELAKRLQLPCSLLALDVDFLKRINDTLGHVGGDQIIQLYSQVIDKNSRQSDLKGRVGGDEFCVFLLGSDLDQSIKVANRMRENIIEAVKSLFPDLAWEQTMSIGIAELKKDDTVPILREKADRSLYKAKERRNTTIVYVEPTSKHI